MLAFCALDGAEPGSIFGRVNAQWALALEMPLVPQKLPSLKKALVARNVPGGDFIAFCDFPPSYDFQERSPDVCLGVVPAIMVEHGEAFEKTHRGHLTAAADSHRIGEQPSDGLLNGVFVELEHFQQWLYDELLMHLPSGGIKRLSLFVVVLQLDDIFVLALTKL